MWSGLRWCAGMALAVWVCGAQAAQRNCQYDTHYDLQYGQGTMTNGVMMPLKLDAYLPRDCVPAPLTKYPSVIVLPGAGFGTRVAFRKSPDLIQIAEGLASDGFAAFIASYRPHVWHGETAVSETMTDQQLQAYRELVQGGPYSVEASMSALIAVEDTYKIPKWLRTKAAQFKLNPDIVGVMGASSGATTAVSMTYMGDNLGEGPPGIKATVNLWGDFYPHGFMTPGEGPSLTVIGTKDAVIPYAQTTVLMHQAFLTDVDASRITMPGVGHGLPDGDIFHRIVSGTDMTIFDVIVLFFETKMQPQVGQKWPPPGLTREMTTDPLSDR